MEMIDWWLRTPRLLSWASLIIALAIVIALLTGVSSRASGVPDVDWVGKKAVNGPLNTYSCDRGGDELRVVSCFYGRSG